MAVSAIVIVDLLLTPAADTTAAKPAKPANAAAIPTTAANTTITAKAAAAKPTSAATTAIAVINNINDTIPSTVFTLYAKAEAKAKEEKEEGEEEEDKEVVEEEEDIGGRGKEDEEIKPIARYFLA
ncbi:hypothetical protein P8C59_001201 [Phyllachora maydis]|uniref:Uncharacterized protein n=1 Tax=Phyllachora maydis TaxID=1825666 RepID=A0AAD9HXX9_9PEZI|nr:hypothetical protein P8C59_001201 [Phyllachora maydis]